MTTAYTTPRLCREHDDCDALAAWVAAGNPHPELDTRIPLVELSYVDRDAAARVLSLGAFAGDDLTAADLLATNLRGANLSRANLTRANLSSGLINPPATSSSKPSLALAKPSPSSRC